MSAQTANRSVDGDCQVLRRRDVEGATGFSRSKIYNLMDQNSKYYDPTFPKPIRLAGGGSISGRTVVWLKAEVEDWLTNQISKYRSS